MRAFPRDHPGDGGGSQCPRGEGPADQYPYLGGVLPFYQLHPPKFHVDGTISRQSPSKIQKSARRSPIQFSTKGRSLKPLGLRRV